MNNIDPIELLKQQMAAIEKLPKTDIYQAMVVSHAIKSSIMKSANISENIFAPITGIEVFPCEGMPDDEVVTFKDKMNGYYFIETVRQYGYEKAKELYNL